MERILPSLRKEHLPEPTREANCFPVIFVSAEDPIKLRVFPYFLNSSAVGFTYAREFLSVDFWFLSEKNILPLVYC